MHSAVLILPIELKEAGDAIGAAMGWGHVSYSIPLSADGASEATHVGLRADVQPTFIQIIAAAKQGIYPDALPEAVLRPVIEALIADFSPDPSDPEKPVLWGADHFEAVCAAHGLTRLGDFAAARRAQARVRIGEAATPDTIAAVIVDDLGAALAVMGLSAIPAPPDVV